MSSQNRSTSKRRRVTIIRKTRHRDGSVDVDRQLFHDVSVKRALELLNNDKQNKDNLTQEGQATLSYLTPRR